MDDVAQLKSELEILRTEMASLPIATILTGEYRTLRDREWELLRRIANLAQVDDHRVGETSMTDELAKLRAERDAYLLKIGGRPHPEDRSNQTKIISARLWSLDHRIVGLERERLTTLE